MRLLFYIIITTIGISIFFKADVQAQGESSEKLPSIKIALIGNSTMEDNSGWGQAFPDKFNYQVTILNFAVGGRSSKSWYNEGRLTEVLEAKPDYIFIEFGHNDQPDKGEYRETNPKTIYRDFLKIYVDSARSIGAVPILLSPVTRRNFKKDGKIKSSLGPWAKGTKVVAKENNVVFIDLWRISIRFHNELGEEASMAFNPKPNDRTHFNEKGANAISVLIVEELKKADSPLADYLMTN